MDAIKCANYDLFFKNMSSKVRIKIITALLEKPLNVTEICTAIDEEQSKVSHNLTNLVECNIVTVQQMGKNRVYTLNKQTVEPILRLVDSHAACNCTAEQRATCGQNKKDCPKNK